MKTLLLFFAGILICNAQISAGEELAELKTLSNGNRLGLEITYTESDAGNVYVMTYRNRKYFDLVDWGHISFTATPDELQSLYLEWDALYDSQKEKAYVLNDARITAFPKGEEIYFYVDRPAEAESFFIMKRRHLSKAFGY